MHKVFAVATLLAVAAVSVRTVSSKEVEHPRTPLAFGLDHIPLAVADLEMAAQRYRQLGFTLKPGRPHDNGIRNQHAKFPDGTEIELITAVEARDALTIEYLRHLIKGDGPVFVAFFAPDMDSVARQLDAAGRTYRRAEGLLSFPEGDDLRYIFFGHRNRSPTDRSEHFRHANGAEALIGVWIAGDDLSAEQDLLARMGASIAGEDFHVPENVRGTVARLPQAEILFLPDSRQLKPGRRIVGATVRTRDLEALRRVLAVCPWNMPPVVRTKHGSSMFLPPDLTHGIWLEFREQ
jgi:catechol 2,3-dioxygenase-like lactoylglutathione lyase family enzyme